MKRFVRVAVASLVLLGASLVGAPQRAEAATAMVISVQVLYEHPIDQPLIGCPSAVQFSPLPPEVTDPCAWPRGVMWYVTGVGAITGGSGALGAFNCWFVGEGREVLAYGEGEVEGQCEGGGVIGWGTLTGCAIRYTRIGLSVTGVVNGCMLGAIAFQLLPNETTFRGFAGIGTLDGA
jgi:hypothetical protein